MRKINKWLATLLAVLLVAGCLPLGALAEGEGELPYGITSKQDIRVEQLEESDELLADMKTEAEQYHLGVAFEGVNPLYGTLLSPFKLSSSASAKVVSITMEKPDRKFPAGMEGLDDPQFFGFKIAVQNTTDGALVHFFPATIDTESSTVNATIPLTNGSPVLCALVSYQIGDEPLNVNCFKTSESILENSDGSVVPFTWKFQVAQPQFGGVFGGTYNNISKSEIRLDLGSLKLESSSVQLTTEDGEDWKVFDIGEIKETAEDSGVWIIELKKPENVENNTYINGGYEEVTLSFDAVLSHEDFAEGVQSPIIAELGVAHFVDAANSGGPAILGMAEIDELSVTPAVTVAPVDLTIYQGGDKGYECVVGDGSAEGEPSTSLPHPLFKITAPSGTSINPEDLTFTTADGSKSWKVVSDGNDYYHFEAGENQQPVRVTYTDSQGKKVLSDEFDPATVGDVYAEYEIALYPGENDFSKIKASADCGNTSYPISVNTGKLTVRAVAKDDPTSDVVTEISSSVAAGSATAVAPADTKYTLNNTGVQLPDDSAPSLLFDDIIEDSAESTARTKALQDKVDATLGKAETTRHYQAKYLDLVDANNGNAWIKASGDVDIYWGYPAGTDRTTKFTLLHFKGLHRDGEESGFELSDLEDIQPENIETVTVTKEDEGINFSISSGGFSPFVLVWEDKPEPEPTPPPYIPPVDDDDDQPEDPDDTGVSDLLNTKDHDQYLFGYPEGTFGPGLNMTRAEAAQMFYNLLVDQDVEAPSVFDDVPEGAWYAEPVNVMAKLGIVKGVGDDKFEPDREITRAEFTAMAMRFAEGETGGKNIFSDVDEDDWFYDVVVDSIKYGWIEGYPDGTFRPQNLITREEVTTIVNRMLGRLPDEDYIDAHEDDLDLFPDVTKNWAYYDVVEATNDHQYKKTSSGEDWTKLG